MLPFFLNQISCKELAERLLEWGSSLIKVEFINEDMSMEDWASGIWSKQSDKVEQNEISSKLSVSVETGRVTSVSSVGIELILLSLDSDGFK